MKQVAKQEKKFKRMLQKNIVKKLNKILLPILAQDPISSRWDLINKKTREIEVLVKEKLGHVIHVMCPSDKNFKTPGNSLCIKVKIPTLNNMEFSVDIINKDAETGKKETMPRTIWEIPDPNDRCTCNPETWNEETHMHGNQENCPIHGTFYST